MRKDFYTPEERKEYVREWRKKHPHYTRDWNRRHRNKHITDLDSPNRRGRGVWTKGTHCNRCSILLSSQYAEGHDGKTCGHCLSTIVV